MADASLEALCAAARAGELPELRRLLAAAAPQLATATDAEGQTALMYAVRAGQDEAAVLLLEAAPAAALVQDAQGWLPLHRACLCRTGQSGGCGSSTLRRLLEAAPAAASAPTQLGYLPLHYLAMWAGEPLLQQLLEAAPAAASAANALGINPLHVAAMHSNAAAVRVLLAAEPGAAAATRGSPPARRYEGAAPELPLEMALSELEHQWRYGGVGRVPECLEAARLLLPATPLEDALAALAAAGQAALPLFADLAACWPLSQEQWERFPCPCPGLGAALPAVLARSEAGVSRLVARLTAGERQRLRTAALCLARAAVE